MRFLFKPCDKLGYCAATILIMVLAGAPICAEPRQTFRQGQIAFLREDFALAARILNPLARTGDPGAQTYLGFMFESGRGVPQNFTEAAYWYRRAAEQGNSTAQYTLGLLYDKGFGVRQDTVEASKWLNLSTANSSKDSRDYRARLRDAVTTKMTRGQIAEARRRALEWYPKLEPRYYANGTVENSPFVRLK